MQDMIPGSMPIAANADGKANAPAPMTVFVRFVTDDRIEALPWLWTSRIVRVDLTDRVDITLLRRSSGPRLPFAQPSRMTLSSLSNRNRNLILEAVGRWAVIWRSDAALGFSERSITLWNVCWATLTASTPVKADGDDDSLAFDTIPILWSVRR